MNSGRLAAALLAVLAFTVALPSAAHASRAPTPRERAELIGATHLDGQIPPRREWAAKKMWVSDLRISTVNHTWAAGQVNEIFNGGDDRAELLYHFSGRSWRLRALGTSGVFCKAPFAVVKDLGGTEGGCTYEPPKERCQAATAQREEVEKGVMTPEEADERPHPCIEVSAQASSASTPRWCGSVGPRAEPVASEVEVARGKTQCAEARKVMHTFMTGNRGPRYIRKGYDWWTVEGWQCESADHGEEAGCERNRGRDFIFALTNHSASSWWEGPSERQERAEERDANAARSQYGANHVPGQWRAVKPSASGWG
jgi:hypothetical protein